MINVCVFGREKKKEGYRFIEFIKYLFFWNIVVIESGKFCNVLIVNICENLFFFLNWNCVLFINFIIIMWYFLFFVFIYKYYVWIILW